MKTTTRPYDAAEYLALKNLSCQTLSKDFEITVHTEAVPAISGFIPALWGSLIITVVNWVLHKAT